MAPGPKRSVVMGAYTSNAPNSMQTSMIGSRNVSLSLFLKTVYFWRVISTSKESATPILDSDPPPTTPAAVETVNPS
ncbi:unnamed protein product [Echinostoma caproni]|uniref:Uncharacterized protein n=1 Tax=Echinostoma caproni TaxID=27848 RepID=A0A183A3P9_9TREM|nr:unnamed protein product [Echinostoma caproni]